MPESGDFLVKPVANKNRQDATDYPRANQQAKKKDFDGAGNSVHIYSMYRDRS